MKQTPLRRLKTILPFGVAAALLSAATANAECHYYNQKLCPQYYACFGKQWTLVDTAYWFQRWDCGSGYIDPLYTQSRNCKYTNPTQGIDQDKFCGPIEMYPRTDANNQPISCPNPLPCVGPGSPVNPPGSGSGT